MIKLKRLNVQGMAFVNKDQQVNLLGSGYTYTFSSDGTYTQSEDGNTHNTIVAGGSERIIYNELTCEPYSDMYGNLGGSEITGLDYDGFKFLADNTDVEWGAYFNGGFSASGGTPCILQTSHSHTACLAATGSGYDTYLHSHPAEGNSDYSPSDWEAWRDMYINNDVTNFGIYTVSNRKIKDHSNDVIYNQPDFK